MSTAANDTPDLDALVIGAGMSGLYMLHRLRDTLGLRAQVIESADDVGGTWYWNRYPGARCDSESYFYSFSDRLDEKLLQEWTWSERFAAQPEILSYLQTVADRFDLRRDIRFSTKVTAATWDEGGTRWIVDTDDGKRTSARHLITAVGCLSTTNLPDFPGRDTFRGTSYHTGEWPHEGVDFTGKRVVVIGTGATAVQAIPEIAEQAEHVTVLQRTPNYDIAGGNRPMTEHDAKEIKSNYTDIWARTRQTGFGFPYDIADRPARSVRRGRATPDLRGGVGARRVPARHDVQRPAPRRGRQLDRGRVPAREDPRRGAGPGDRGEALTA